MVPIEDFILALKDAASCSILDADVLERYVQKNYVPCLRHEHYCAVHIHQEGDKDLRCQQARRKKITEPYLDFILVLSITAKDPTPDTRHMSQFRRAFDNPTSSKRRQPLLEEEDDDDECPNVNEDRAADEDDR